MIRFALPMLIGSIIQQLYSTVDAWVVGNYVNNEAFSAVGSVTPIINSLIGFFTGLASGTGVVVARFFGADDKNSIDSAVHTASAITLVLVILFSIFGIILTPTALHLTNTPDTVFPEAKVYLQIYFSGIAGLLIYNMGAGILRAIGNSLQPFLFLIVSTVTNIILDLFFVIGLHLGIRGVAYATIIAQGMSALMIITVFCRRRSYVRLSARKIRIDPSMLKSIIHISIPMAIQSSVTAFSNMFVQAYINSFGTFCMGGWAVYNKLDQFMILPTQAMGFATTTFVSQNLGAKKTVRAKRGTVIALIISMLTTFIVLVPVWVYAKSLVMLFNKNERIIYYGILLLRVNCPFLLVHAISPVMQGTLRGAGESRHSMIICLSCYVLFRQIYLYIVNRFLPGHFIVIALGYPVGWVMCSICITAYYLYNRKRLLGEAE